MYKFHKEMEWLNPPRSLREEFSFAIEVYPERFEAIKDLLDKEVFYGATSDPPWPGKAEGVWRWFLLPDDVIVGEKKAWEFVVEKRLPNEEYWPSEEICRASIPLWAAKLKEALLEYCKELEFSDPADHYLYGKRRYGIKRNPLNRIAYLVGVDPEGRYRFRYERMPDYIYECLKQADYECGNLLGVEDRDREVADD